MQTAPTSQGGPAEPAACSKSDLQTPLLAQARHPESQTRTSRTGSACSLGRSGSFASTGGGLGGGDHAKVGRLFRHLGLRTSSELNKVSLFVLSAFLANTMFVIGRNVGTVLFMTRGQGAEYLTEAMVASGVLTVVVGSFLSWGSKGVLSTTVYGMLLLSSAVVLGVLYLAVLVLDGNLPSLALPEIPNHEEALRFTFTLIFIAEDMLAMFVAMQCSTVAQTAFTATDAKRLFGFVQLGNSVAAVSVGLGIGSIAEVLGTEQLLLAQVVICLVSLVLNAHIAIAYVEPLGVGGAGGRKKKARIALDDAGPGDAGPWWKNPLVAVMGFWSFSVIFAKTMYEYEYNVLVAERYTEEEMVSLTGYLYAGAGVASSVVNVLGMQVCMRTFGVKGAILVTPGCLLVASLAILVKPSVATTFLGRLVDLSLRWSINNTVRSVLWLAVPVAQAAAAKPWIEGTIKKLASTFSAAVIYLTLWASGHSFGSLSLSSFVITLLLLVCCLQVYTLYLDSMWGRIKRRELASESAIGNDPNISGHLRRRLLRGGAAEQLYILREIGEGLKGDEWEAFFQHFREFPSAVQAEIVKLGRKQPERIPDHFLVELIQKRATNPAVVTVAILAVGERGLHEAVELLEARLGDHMPAVRAAAATAILRIGWGVGLGTSTSSALRVLESMLGFTLAGAPLRRRRSSKAVVAHFGAQESQASGQTASVGELQMSWEDAIQAHDISRAVAVAIQLTYAKAALHDKDDSMAAAPNASQLSPSLRMCTTEAKRQVSGGCGSSVSSPTSTSIGKSGQEALEVATALKMLQQLPAPLELVRQERWMDLLQDSSHQVQVVALSFVPRAGTLQFKEGIARMVKCLCCPDTFDAAEKALWRLDCPLAVQDEVLNQIRIAKDDHKRSRSTWPASPVRAEAPPQAGEGEAAAGRSAGSLLGLLKYLQRQRRHAARADLQELFCSGVCDKLLDFYSELSDTDALLQLLSTVVDLKAHGFAVTQELAMTRAREVLRQIFKGLAVQQSVKELACTVMPSQAEALRSYLDLAQSAESSACLSPGKEDVRIVLQTAKRYIDEHIYLLKLQLFHLIIIAAVGTTVATESTRVLAAWRVLRSSDASSQAAVLEVLESMVPMSLKAVVLTLLDDSPLDKKLSAGASFFGDESLACIGSPRRMEEWFRLRAERLGDELGYLCQVLAEGSAGGRRLPKSAPSSALLPKLALLCPLRLYRDLLATHAAEIAAIARLVHVPENRRLCQEGETYVVVAGSFQACASGKTYGRGDVIQELHALQRELKTVSVVCTSPGGATVLRIREKNLHEIMLRLPPKFVLGLVKSLIRVLPAPTQTGGTSIAHPVAAEQPTSGVAAKCSSEQGAIGDLPAQCSEALVFLDRQHGNDEKPQAADDTDTGGSSDQDVEEDSGEDTGEGSEESQALGTEPGVVYGPTQGAANQRQQTTFSMVEKLVLVQGVKIFRCVPNEHLPRLAACCNPAFYRTGSQVFCEDEPTDATLYIVAEGVIGLYSHTPGCSGSEQAPKRTLKRRLKAGDSMGNTGLFFDSKWPYSAAAEEDTWLLCISRSDLTDLLRGRRELAAAVIGGLLRSFTRRMQQASDLEVRSREWLIEADYSRNVEGSPETARLVAPDPLAFASPPPMLMLPPSRHTIEQHLDDIR